MSEVAGDEWQVPFGRGSEASPLIFLKLHP